MNIIADLADISKIEDEIYHGKYQIVSIEEQFDEVMKSLSALFEKSDAKLIKDFDVKEVPFLKKNLRSILLNLLSNALKYRSPDRKLEIKVKTEETEEFIVLSVEDNGLGIDKDEIGGVFTKYKRIHGTASELVDGTGIGLYLTKKIMDNSGGKIEVSSQLGKGSTFRVSFLKE